MATPEADSAWKKVMDKLAIANLLKKSLSGSRVLDVLTEIFNDKELESVTDDLVKEVHSIVEDKPARCLFSWNDFQNGISKHAAKYPQLSFINDRLKMGLFIFSLLKSDNPQVIEQCIKSFLPMHRDLGMPFCQMLCDPTVTEKAKKFLKGVSIDEVRDNMLKAMKEVFKNSIATARKAGSKDGTKRLLNVIHMISCCGDYITSIIDPEIEDEINLNEVALVTEDAKALGKAIHHCSFLRKLSLQACQLNSNFFPDLYSKLRSSKLKIIELDVSCNPDVNFSILGLFFKERQVQKLGIRDCSVNFQKLTDFAEKSEDAKIVELDVSGNGDIDFSLLGELCKKREIQKLRMPRCSLDFKKLSAFSENSGEGKIFELDVSWNKDMDFTLLGNLVKKHQVQKLSMRYCDLNFKKLDDFTEYSGEEKILELDVSWNAALDFSCLGTLVKKHEVQKIVMRYCSLNVKKLNDFSEKSGNRKIIEVDVSFNREMGVEGLESLSRLIEKHSVERLMIQKCGLHYKNLNGVNDGSVLRKIFSAVTNYIDIYGNIFTLEDMFNLQKNLRVINGNNLKVVHGDGCLPLNANTELPSTEQPNESDSEKSTQDTSIPDKATTPSSTNTENQRESETQGNAVFMTSDNATVNIEFKYSPDSKNNGSGKQSGSISLNSEPLFPNKQVYPAKRHHLSGSDEDVVVKLLQKTETRRKEVDKLVRLATHPNVVRILESGVCGPTQMFIVMERCQQNLRQYVTTKNFRLTKSESFFRQTVLAVNFIHSSSIIHRDLKPENILISRCSDFVKICDFGISEDVPDNDTVVAVTCHGSGTEGFKPPEAYTDRKKIGYKSDIYSLAINGFFMFTHGKHPFGDNPLAWALNITENKNPNLSGIPKFPKPNRRRQLIVLLTRMLSYSRERRPTAVEVKDNVFFTK